MYLNFHETPIFNSNTTYVLDTIMEYCIQCAPPIYPLYHKIGYMTKKYRSSRPEVFYKKGVLKNFTKFAGKHLCQSLTPATLLKKRLWHRCFSVNFVKFLRTPFYIEHLWWLLLKIKNTILAIGKSIFLQQENCRFHDLKIL